LALGRTVVGVGESAVKGTLVEDTRQRFGPAVDAVRAMGSPSGWNVRVSASYKDVKGMLGTDRVGVQYKERSGQDATVKVDQVVRSTHRWGDDAFSRDEVMLEKNFRAVRLPIPGRVFGVPLNTLQLVPGVRENLSRPSAPTPSLNLELPLPNKSDWKIAIELRRAGG